MTFLPWLCRLVEMVIKHHRLRLDGRFHNLIPTLQAILQRVLARPYTAQEEHAKLFIGLIRLICEPTDDAIARSARAGGGLDSAKDSAKRYAGDYMYLVLTQYIKLQLECAVPHAVRETLDTGMYAVLDVTAPGGLAILHDSMDPSGRVVFKELYRRYQRFGKWSGV